LLQKYLATSALKGLSTFRHSCTFTTWSPSEIFFTTNFTTTPAEAMHTLNKAVILWLPALAFYTTLIYILVLCRQSGICRAYGKFPESPTLALWIPIVFFQIYTLLRCGKQLSDIKVAIFWSLLFTTLAIRCLTMLSAFCSYEDDTLILLLFNACPAKPFFLSVVCEWVVWGRTCLGTQPRGTKSICLKSKTERDFVPHCLSLYF